jgi:hypothetical protein
MFGDKKLAPFHSAPRCALAYRLGAINSTLKENHSARDFPKFFSPTRHFGFLWDASKILAPALKIQLR